MSEDITSTALIDEVEDKRRYDAELDELVDPVDLPNCSGVRARSTQPRGSWTRLRRW